MFPSNTLEKIKPHNFNYLAGSSNAPAYQGHFGITTLNSGLMTITIHRFQTVANSFAEWSPKKEKALKEKKLDSPHVRGPRIAERLAAEAKNVPIIGGTEFFDVNASQRAAESLAKAGYHVYYRGGKKLGITSIFSGLLLASRYPIKQFKFYFFTNLNGADAYSSKGVIKAKISVPLKNGKNRDCIIFLTHLQAQLGADKREIRKKQLEAAHTLVEKGQKCESNAYVFLMGDLNITDTEHNGEWSGEYSDNISIFDKYHNILLQQHTGKGEREEKAPKPLFLDYDRALTKMDRIESPRGTWYDLTKLGTNEAASGCIYDHILILKNEKEDAVKDAIAEIRSFMGDGLSDHAAITIVLPHFMTTD